MIALIMLPIVGISPSPPRFDTRGNLRMRDGAPLAALSLGFEVVSFDSQAGRDVSLRAAYTWPMAGGLKLPP